MSAGSLAILASLVTAAGAGLLMRALTPPPRRLHRRIAPYLTPHSSVAASATVGALPSSVFGPIVHDAADWVGRLADRAGGEVTALRLKQAGWFTGSSDKEMIASYRLLLLRGIALTVSVGVLVGHVLGASVGLRLALAALSVVVGFSRAKGSLDNAIESRRQRMRIEIYTVNQLLAMRVRAGGGVIQAIKAITRRGTGEVVGELEDALRLHRAGRAGPDALRRVAELSPEPFCARTYRLLAAAEERGADLAAALLSLSEDARETRREAIKRMATRRRAAMLVPTIAILAPVLILFVAAPLPYLITGWQ